MKDLRDPLTQPSFFKEEDVRFWKGYDLPMVTKSAQSRHAAQPSSELKPSDI